MATSPSFFVNSPVSGTQYWSKLWCGVVDAGGDSLSVTVKAWSGANGTGSLVAVTSIQVWIWDFTTGTSVSTGTGSGVNTQTRTSSLATAGHTIQCSGKYTGSAIGSLEMFIQYTSSTAFTPTTPSFSPSTGAPGSSVAITGSRFTDATDVQFNGTSASSFTINNDGSITATVPSGATTGPIAIVNPAGSGTSASNFTPGMIWFGNGSGVPVVPVAIWYGDGSGVPHKVAGVWIGDGSGVPQRRW